MEDREKERRKVQEKRMKENSQLFQSNLIDNDLLNDPLLRRLTEKNQLYESQTFPIIENDQPQPEEEQFKSLEESWVDILKNEKEIAQNKRLSLIKHPLKDQMDHKPKSD